MPGGLSILSVARHSNNGRFPTFHSCEHPENATCHRNSATGQPQPQLAQWDPELSNIALNSRKIFFRRILPKNVIKNNLVGGAKKDVINQLPACLYFVIFTTPVFYKTFVTDLVTVGRSCQSCKTAAICWTFLEVPVPVVGISSHTSKPRRHQHNA